MAADCGLDGVELDLGSLEQGLPLSDARVCRYWLDAQQRCAVAFPALAVNTLGGHCRVRPENPGQEALCRRIVSAAIDAAAAMGIGVIQIPNFGGFAIGGEADIEPASRFYRWACELAGPRDILIASENTLSADENLWLCDQVDRSNFRIYYDNENVAFFTGESPAAHLRAIGPRACQVHLKDGSPDALSSKPLGEGHGQAEPCLSALRDMGYGGWVVLENEYAGEAFGSSDRFESLQRDVDWIRARL